MMCHLRTPVPALGEETKLFGVALYPAPPHSFPPPLEASASPLVCSKEGETPIAQKRETEAALKAEGTTGVDLHRGLSFSLSLSVGNSLPMTMGSSPVTACPSLFPGSKQRFSATVSVGLDLNKPASNGQASLALPRVPPRLEPVDGCEAQLSSQSNYSAAEGKSPRKAVKAATSSGGPGSSRPSSNRYEVQKVRDWQAFEHYLGALSPPVFVNNFRGSHVVQFLQSLDQFGKTKIHTNSCAFFGTPAQRTPCNCPMKQAWGSLDSLIGRLRAAHEECGGKIKENPFGEEVVRQYLREVRQVQAIARGMDLDKKRKRKGAEDLEQERMKSAASLKKLVLGVERAKIVAHASEGAGAREHPW